MMRDFIQRIVRTASLAILLSGVVQIDDTAVAQSARRLDGSYHYVANTRPPDAFLALRTHPSSRLGSRIMAMRNGTLLQVLDRRPDGWWQVRVVPSGEEGWALSGQGNRQWIECCAAASGSRSTDALKKKIRVCRGILTVNWTESVKDGSRDDGQRLVRADDINNSCLFHRDDLNGRRILAECRMGFPCEVKVIVSDEPADVFFIDSVLSVRRLE
jgi:hypothetical protein